MGSFKVGVDLAGEQSFWRGVSVCVGVRVGGLLHAARRVCFPELAK